MPGNTDRSTNINLIKFGGSIITKSSEDGFFNAENTSRLGNELSQSKAKTVIVHGTGLVGKIPARKYGYVDSGIIPQDQSDVALEVQRDLRELGKRFISTLSKQAHPVVPLATSNYFNLEQSALHNSKLAFGLRAILNGGGIPVFRGELIPHPDGSFRVFSSDTIIDILTCILLPDNVFLLTDVPGVFAKRTNANNRSNRIIPVLTPENVDQVRKLDSDKSDVSGAMSAKIAMALKIASKTRHCANASGITPGILEKLLTHKAPPCTWVTPNRTP